MVEFTGTTPSEAGGNGQGSITSFASRLDAATLAAVGDPTVERGGIQSLAPSGPSSSDYKSASAAFAKDLMNKFPGLFTVNQGKTLFDIYSKDDTYVTATIIQRMKDDKFLLETTTGWLVMSEYIDGNLIAEALFRNAGLPSDGTMTAEQFLPATQKLFGDYTKAYNGFVLTPQISKFLAQVYGADGKIKKQNMASMFNSGTNSIIEVKMGLVSKDYFGLFVRPTNVSTDFDQVVPFATLVAFMMTNDADNNGWLSTAELKIAVNGTDRGQSSANDAAVQTYMNCYGKKDSSGNWEINIDGLTLMLSDRSLNQPTELTGSDFSSWGDPFLVDLNLIPITRVIWGASYGDQQSLNDGILSQGELIKLFGGLGQTVSPAQAKLLVDVYGDGTFVTQANVQQMRNDGFFSLATEVSKTCTLNWDSIPATTLARAIFKQVGIDPDAAGATVTADQFNTGFNLLYSGTQVKPLKDPVGLTKYFGLENKLTIAQMSSALAAVNTDVSIPFERVPVAGGEGLTEMVPAFHASSWWGTVIGFVEGAEADVVSTISTISGVADDIVAQLFNGTKDLAAMMVNEGNKIIPAIVDAIKKGDETAKKLMDTLGSALTKIPGLTDNEKKFITDMVTSAKSGLDYTVTSSVCTLVGLPPDAAKKAIKKINLQNELTALAKDLTVDKMSTLIPDYQRNLEDMVKMMDAAIAALPNDAASLQKLAEQGYTLDSNNNLVKDGIVMSADESKDVFAQFFRLDLGIEFNFGAVIEGFLNGGLVSTFFAYKGTINGDPQFELRFRVIDEAGVGFKSPYGGVDGGLVNVHDLVIPWSTPKDGGPPIKKDILWNSSIAGVVEAQVNLKPPEFGTIQTIYGVVTSDGMPPVPATWLNSGSFEIGGGWGMTVSYNLSKIAGNVPGIFFAEIAGAAAGAAIGVIGIGGLALVTEGAALAVASAFGVTIINAMQILGSFAADATVRAIRGSEGGVEMNHGFFIFGAVRENISQVDLGTVNFGLRGRLQISYSNDPWGIM